MTRKNPQLSYEDAIYAFTKAMRDPDQSADSVALDVLLENDITLADAATDVMNNAGRIDPTQGDQGMFEFAGGPDTHGWILWRIELVKQVFYTPKGREIVSVPLIKYGVSYDGHTFRADVELPIDMDPVQIKHYAAGYGWKLFVKLKQWDRELYGTEAVRKAILSDIEEGAELPALPPQLVGQIATLEANPRRVRKNPDDLAAAREKYKQFHRLDPNEEVFEDSFEVPDRMMLAGTSKWVTYRSSKVDPATLKRPKEPVDYIHEHNAGVCTYIPDPDADTDVPGTFRDVEALVRLGQCLGFCVVDGDGEDVEAKGTSPLPDLYSTPDGKCLFVIQGRKKVLAMIWGGGLGVYARGIDG